jgi:hypothetical protein
MAPEVCPCPLDDSDQLSLGLSDSIKVGFTAQRSACVSMLEIEWISASNRWDHLHPGGTRVQANQNPLSLMANAAALNPGTGQRTPMAAWHSLAGLHSFTPQSVSARRCGANLSCVRSAGGPSRPWRHQRLRHLDHPMR